MPRLKPSILSSVLVAVVLFCSSCNSDQKSVSSSANDNEPATRTQSAVIDNAGLISSTVEGDLEDKLANLEMVSGPQIVILTTKSLGAKPIETYSIDLARKWQIGSAERMDGVLVVVAPNERKVRIEVGYGLEASLTDEFCSEIIEKSMIPHFREGEYESGIVAGLNAIMTKVRQTPTKVNRLPLPNFEGMKVAA